jgi:hypothetical protein
MDLYCYNGLGKSAVVVTRAHNPPKKIPAGGPKSHSKIHFINFVGEWVSPFNFMILRLLPKHFETEEEKRKGKFTFF